MKAYIVFSIAGKDAIKKGKSFMYAEEIRRKTNKTV